MPQARASTGTAGYAGFGSTIEPPGSANRQVSADDRFGGARHHEHVVRIDAVQRRDAFAQ